MFVDCSEISINVIVKHVQHVGIIRTCSLPGMELWLSFSVPRGVGGGGGRGQKNCWVDTRTDWFAKGINT